jgi:hypothetical protein
VLTTDANNSPVSQLASSSAHPVECADRSVFAIQWDMEQVSCVVWAVSGLELTFSHPKAEFFERASPIRRRSIVTADHPFPEGKFHSFRVGISKPRPTLLIENFPTNFHQV